MACYVVTYEPIGNGASEAIKARLKSLPGYCPINAYSWAVTTPMTAVQVRDHIQQASPTSRIFVVRSGTEAAWINTYGTANSDWLKKNL